MSQITKQEVERVAKLTRIKIEDSQKEEMTKQLSKTLTWVENLNEVNVDGVEPLVNVHNINLKLFDDKVSMNNSKEDILRNAPAEKYDYFSVPKIIE